MLGCACFADAALWGWRATNAYGKAVTRAGKIQIKRRNEHDKMADKQNENQQLMQKHDNYTSSWEGGLIDLLYECWAKMIKGQTKEKMYV